MRYPNYIEEPLHFPDFSYVRMQSARDRLLDVPGAAEDALERALGHCPIGSGQSVAVGVGSRGIANLPVIVAQVCGRLRRMGARPVIIPAMGSHGGAAAEGQVKVLQALGVTAERCGAPVRSTMAVEQIGEVFGEVPVFFARDALAQDHTICINRIKPHTKFKGELESGIAKMLCVGLGKHEGALAYHRWAPKHGFLELLREMGGAAAAHSNFRFGLGVVENACDETLKIEVVSGRQGFEQEAALLRLAKKHFPRLPFKQLDVLVIARIGKEISGAGMDPNVTGRSYDLMESDFSECLQATRVVVLNLTAKTAGNAIGLGNADITTEKVFAALDYESTLMNALTSLSLRKAFIPVRLPDDRRAIQAGFATLGPVPPEAVRAVIIRDTLHVLEFWASAALRRELEKNRAAQIVTTAPLAFDAEGNLELPPAG